MAETKVSQVLSIDPARELIFKGPFTDVVNATITLRNPSDRPICFKVKTTAPKQYCVRPNSGVVPPKDIKFVTVMLQPLDQNADCTRHKFMVQTCYAPSEDVDLDQIWKACNPADLMYSKLMVVFEESTSPALSMPREESPAAIHYAQSGASPSGSENQPRAKETPSKSHTQVDEKLRVEVDRLEREKKGLKKDLDDVLKKVAKLQNDSERSEVGVPTLQVILMAVAALLIGLIFGKLI
ncbi:unnamed protein product [Auanema sp. JU1783]|nr:unnamed protein product [Auanema sp. JU1783]